MRVNHSITVAEAAKDIGCTKSYIFRLITQNRLVAVMQTGPVKYYLIDPVSVEKFKNTPKNKGGRPRKVKPNKR